MWLVAAKHAWKWILFDWILNLGDLNFVKMKNVCTTVICSRNALFVSRHTRNIYVWNDSEQVRLSIFPRLLYTDEFFTQQISLSGDSLERKHLFAKNMDCMAMLWDLMMYRIKLLFLQGNFVLVLFQILKFYGALRNFICSA